MEDNLIRVANQLEHLTAQSPTANDGPHVSPGDYDMDEAPVLEMELDVLERTISPVATPAYSDLTEIDDAIPQDPMGLAPESQLITTDTHFTDPAAPRVSYEVSSDGVVMVEEQSQDIKPVVHQASSSPATTTVLFERYVSQISTPNVPGSPRIPPSLAVERIMGPKKPIPEKILETLEDWHALHPGSTEHPCAIKTRAPSAWENFKVFDDDAGEHDLSIFRISVKIPSRRTVNYNILVLHSENGPEELVVFSKFRPKTAKIRKGTLGMYLLAWIEAESKWEEKVCAIKVWRTDNEEIFFDPRMFDNGNKRSSVFVSSISSKALGSGLITNNKSKDDGKYSESSSPHTPLLQNRSQIAYDQPIVKWDKKMNDKDESTTFFEDHSRVLGSPFKPSAHLAKRVKRSPDYQDTAQAAIHASKAQNHRSLIRFKLTANDNLQNRYFDTEDAKVFFKKVREFFDPSPAGLLCTYPGLDSVRYIGFGCVDEFNILLDGIRHASVSGGEERVAVIKPSVSS